MSRFLDSLDFEHEAVTHVQKDDSASNWELLGLELAKEMRYDDSIIAYSNAIARDPFKGILYRYRGHRYISERRFEEGVADLSFAARIIPDNWDVWYHLGLGYYLLGRYEDACKAYEVCYSLSYDNDSKTAITNWYYVTLKRLGLNDEAAHVLDGIPDVGYDVDDSEGYYEIVQINKGVVDKDSAFENLKNKEEYLQLLTIGYGLANSYAFDGNTEKQKEVLEYLTKSLTGSWKYAFGYIATEVDLKNMKQ